MSTRRKDKVVIQGVKDKVLKIYNTLRPHKGLKDTTFYVERTNKVRPSALIRNLNEFRDICDSTEMKNKIDTMINSIEGLAPDGDSKIFISHNCESDGSKLEFVCIVVYKYGCEGGEACGKCNICKACKKSLVCGSCKMCKACEKPIKCKGCKPCKAGKECEEPIACGECRPCVKCQKFKPCGRCEECRKCELVCDYLLTTYSYKEKVNHTGAAVGTGITCGGVALYITGTLASIATGGTGFLIAGLAGSVATLVGSGIVAKSTDTTISSESQNILEAAFIYELVQRKYTQIENNKLYLKLDD